MNKTRRKFTAAEKSKIALDAMKGELTMAEIASKYSVHPTQISTWKKQALTQLPEAFTGKQKQTEKNHAVELSELYEQIGCLKVENEFKKKVRLVCRLIEDHWSRHTLFSDNYLVRRIDSYKITLT